MVDDLKMEMSEKELLEKSDSELLRYLVKIALLNRTDLNHQHLILAGNGDPSRGLCAQVIKMSMHIRGIWATICVGGGFLAGVLTKHVLGG
jgi:hypothetical protein